MRFFYSQEGKKNLAIFTIQLPLNPKPELILKIP